MQAGQIIQLTEIGKENTDPITSHLHVYYAKLYAFHMVISQNHTRDTIAQDAQILISF